MASDQDPAEDAQCRAIVERWEWLALESLRRQRDALRHAVSIQRPATEDADRNGTLPVKMPG